jgi:Ca2+-binding EF-hand superfamily protein
MTGPLKAIAVLALLASAPLAAQQVATTAAERFTRLDVNHDGALSKYEVDAEVFIAGLDTDGDQMISATELAPLLGPSVTEAQALDRVRVADRNADDKLDAAELDRGSEMRFKWMDANGDGNVDQQELTARFGVKMVN